MSFIFSFVNNANEAISISVSAAHTPTKKPSESPPAADEHTVDTRDFNIPSHLAYWKALRPVRVEQGAATSRKNRSGLNKNHVHIVSSSEIESTMRLRSARRTAVRSGTEHASATSSTCRLHSVAYCRQ
ncbi:hypothetical protein EVAR_31555_1 [Eumeta japonica]|uniref:Uncharacterized protein n=1 Tax=Eumeta variegata TaxID=151549 RepID=A0A4C1V880_EUMVA|nr:hypothetical protein EVAR_31555_1 [Eumeta japonica]